MTFPNFLIIGAVKAGTSSIFKYITQHPQVYGAPIKEPSFFAFENEVVNFCGPGDELFNQAVITKYEDYERLFADVNHEMAIGEASVVYLHSDKAPFRIKHYIPNVKLMAILRNPVDRAISSYSHNIRDGLERLSFPMALEVEKTRQAEGWQHIWRYAGLGFYYEALQRYFSLFPRKNIAIYTYEEFTQNPADIIKNIFDFLGVDKSFVPDMTYKHNVSGVPRSRIIHSFLRRQSLVKDSLKLLIPQKYRLSIRMKITERNINPQKIVVDDSIRSALKEVYRNDVLQTQSLIRKDLSAWLA